MISKRELFLNFLGQTSESPYLVEIDKADGIFMFGLDGKKYIDLISGVSVSSLGHNFKPVVDAAKAQLDKHLHLMVYGEFIQSPQVDLAKYIISLLLEYKIIHIYLYVIPNKVRYLTYLGYQIPRCARNDKKDVIPRRRCRASSTRNLAT